MRFSSCLGQSTEGSIVFAIITKPETNRAEPCPTWKHPLVTRSRRKRNEWRPANNESIKDDYIEGRSTRLCIFQCSVGPIIYGCLVTMKRLLYAAAIVADFVATMTSISKFRNHLAKRRNGWSRPSALLIIFESVANILLLWYSWKPTSTLRVGVEYERRRSQFTTIWVERLENTKRRLHTWSSSIYLQEISVNLIW